jgi:CubicO group peptidase (beta-lactamase class C family)
VGSTVRHLLAHASGLGPDSDRPLAAPGRRRIYSNIGFDVLAQTLARHSGMPFTDYVRTGVVLPLDMTPTLLADGSSPASGARGSLRDLLTLAGELLAPRLVSAATMERATSVAFPGLAGVLPGFGRFDPCDWGLGFEIRDAKSPHWTGTSNSPATFGHFGQSGCFVWVDPLAQVACAALSDRAFGPWSVTAWPSLADAVLDAWAGSPAPIDPGSEGSLP